MTLLRGWPGHGIKVIQFAFAYGARSEILVGAGMTVIVVRHWPPLARDWS